MEECQRELKEERCQRLYDAIYTGNNKLAIELIDEFMETGLDFNMCESEPSQSFWLPSYISSLGCDILFYACINNRVVIVKELLETSLLTECIITVINHLLLNYNYSFICEYFMKRNDPESKYDKYDNKYIMEKFSEQRLPISEKWNFIREKIRETRNICKNDYFVKFKRILKLLLSYLTKKQMKLINIPELRLRKMEDELGDDYLIELENGDIGEEQIEATKKSIDEYNSKIVREHNEIIDIIEKHQGTIYHKDIPSELTENNLNRLQFHAGKRRKNKTSKKIKRKPRFKKTKKYMT